MAAVDRVDGVFIDECSSYPDARSKEYLTALTDLAHGYGLIAGGNVGVTSSIAGSLPRAGSTSCSPPRTGTARR